MKPRLLLYLTADANPARNAVAATLSWAAAEAGWFFEVYYDAYRLGEHYGGGDPDWQPAGYLHGGAMVGAHHHERLYLLLHRFDVTVLTDGDVAFAPALEQLDTPRLAVRGFADTYERAFDILGLPRPHALVLLDAQPDSALAGIDAYLYPEVACRRALAVEATSVTTDDLARLLDPTASVEAIYVAPERLATFGERLERAGHARISPRTVEPLAPDDDFVSITAAVAHRRLGAYSGGWILADPATVAAWLPEAMRERRLSIYGKPQQRVLTLLDAELRASKGDVFGRQYEDGDFFTLSALGLPFQLIDPARPPFPVLRHAGYRWASSPSAPGMFAAEPDDDQLRAWLREGRVLTSVVFWTGMIRELENLPRIVDLIALTRLKAGLALTIPALLYQPETALEQLRVPLESGGVYPHLEILLASCGVGATIESRMPEGRLARYLAESACQLDRAGIPSEWRPRGWWAVMDPEMTPLPEPRLPVAVKPSRTPPFVRLRYHSPSGASSAPSAKPAQLETVGDALVEPRKGAKQRVGDWAREHGLREMLSPYRPFEFFAPGNIRAEVVSAVHAAGYEYMFSKAGFGPRSRVLARDGDFIALNYTVGHWDGWTPFETINGLEDLRRAERRLLHQKRPGWLVGTLDTCLWAFTGPIWSHGVELRQMAEFLARGGDTGRLVNVTPHVVARYARLLEKEQAI